MDFLEVLERGRQSEDQRDGRIYGMLEGVVTDVSGPVYGQIKARLGSQQDNESSHWLEPAWSGGVEGIPRSGDPVFVAFVDGDPHRGVYWWHPSSRTKGRASDFMILGTTMVGMFNFLIDQFNQLRTDFNTLASQAAAHTHAYNPGPSPSAFTGPASGSTPPISITSTGAVAANKGKASDGSVVGNQASSVIVLSGHTKVQK